MQKRCPICGHEMQIVTEVSSISNPDGDFVYDVFKCTRCSLYVPLTVEEHIALDNERQEAAGQLRLDL